MNKKLQQIFAFAFGVAFIVVLLVLAVAIPYPTPFQYTVFRVVLALAAAGIAAMFPGFLHVEVSTWLRATGAIAVFVVVFFYNPASLVAAKPDPTAPFKIVLACPTSDRVIVDTFTFPYSDVEKNTDYDSFRRLVVQLPHQRCDQGESKILRFKDELALSNAEDISATLNGNTGVVVVPTDAIAALGGTHLAFTQILSIASK